MRTINDKQRLKQLVEMGYSKNEVADEMGDTRYMVEKAAREMGLQWQKATNKWDEETIERLRQYVADGLTAEEIGIEMGITDRWVEKICRDHGVGTPRRKRKWNAERLRWMEDGMRCGVPLSDMARAIGVAVNTMSAMYKHSSGRTVREYKRMINQ